MKALSERLTRRTLLGMAAVGLGGAIVSTANARLTANHPAPGSALTTDEQMLVQLVNDYRAANSMPTIALSMQLCSVAQWHVIDLMEHHPDTGTDSRGLACNMHSWSAQGNWTPVCYTGDHEYAAGMWDKPREITNNAYNSAGYEIAYKSSATATPSSAMNGWKKSSAHNDMLLNRSMWADITWSAFGVGMYGQYAVVWFGEIADTQAPADQHIYLPAVRH